MAGVSNLFSEGVILGSPQNVDRPNHIAQSWGVHESTVCRTVHRVEDKLILLIAIAYTASCLVGLKTRNTGYQEYINRLKVEGKNRPRHMRSGYATALASRTTRA